MKPRQKYLVAAGIAAAVEIAIFAFGFFARSPDGLAEHIAYALHVPGLYVVSVLRITGHKVGPLLVVVLVALLQYFVIAMACLSLKDVRYLLFKTTSSPTWLPAIRSLLWLVASLGILLTLFGSHMYVRTEAQATRLSTQGRIIHLALFDFVNAGRLADRLGFTADLTDQRS